MIQDLAKLKRHGVAMSAIALTPGDPAFAGTTWCSMSAATP
jgi:hypothetical protein